MFSRLKIFSGNANRELANEVSKYAGIPLGSADVFKFSNDNTFVKILENVRGADVFIIQPTCYPVNDNIMELLIMIDAIKRSSAKKINCVIPYFGYARSDKKDQPRVPITAKLIADLLTTAGADRIIALDLHSEQIQGFFNIPVDHLSALPIFCRYFKEHIDLENIVVVSPDTGGTNRARKLADRLNCSLAIGDKRRIGNNDRIELINVIGEVEGKDVILFDDMIDTGGSLCNISCALKERGVRKVYAACAHGILSGNAIENIIKSPIEKLFITDSIPAKQESKNCEKIIQISIAELLAMAIKKIHVEESLSILFR
jgi:ribose-phosphate pyrophosphokinase